MVINSFHGKELPFANQCGKDMIIFLRDIGCLYKLNCAMVALAINPLPGEGFSMICSVPFLMYRNQICFFIHKLLSFHAGGHDTLFELFGKENGKQNDGSDCDDCQTHKRILLCTHIIGNVV